MQSAERGVEMKTGLVVAGQPELEVMQAVCVASELLEVEKSSVIDPVWLDRALVDQHSELAV